MKKTKLYTPQKSGTAKFTKKRLHDNLSWREYSIKFLAENPKCYACGTRARVVDHVVSAKGDKVKFWDSTNLIPLCKPEHDYITAHFDRHIVAKTEEKMLWIAMRRMETDTNVRVKIVQMSVTT